MIDTSYRHCSRSIKARVKPLRRTWERNACALRRVTRIPNATSQSPVVAPVSWQTLEANIASTRQESARAVVEPATAAAAAAPAARVKNVRFMFPFPRLFLQRVGLPPEKAPEARAAE